MDRQEKVSDYYIGAAVLHALLLLISGTVFVAGLCLSRRRGDTARNVVRWLAITFAFFNL